MSDFKVEIIESEVFPEVKILNPDPFFDYRGEMWTFWEKDNEILPPGHEWKISKFTRSRKNVLRGLHGDNVTWKHITCVWGEVYLVVVDNRPESLNYLKWESYIISERNHLSVLVPPNFVNAHLCLSNECLSVGLTLFGLNSFINAFGVLDFEINISHPSTTQQV